MAFVKVLTLASLALLVAADCSSGACDNDETTLLQVESKLHDQRADQKQLPQMGMEPPMGGGMPMGQMGAIPGMPPMGMQQQPPPPGMMPQGMGSPFGTDINGLPTIPGMDAKAPINVPDVANLQVTQVSLPKDLLPRGIQHHAGSNAPPGMTGLDAISMESVGQMPMEAMFQQGMQPGMQPGMPQAMPGQGAMQGMAPNGQGLPGYMPTVGMYGTGASEFDQSETEEDAESEQEAMSEENVQKVVENVMDVLKTKKEAVTDSVVDRVIEVLGAKKKQADERQAQIEAAQQAKQEAFEQMQHKVERRLEKKVEAKVEQKVRLKVEAKLRREWERRQAEKKRKAEVQEKTLSEMAAAESEAAERAAALNTVSEKRERSIAKTSAEKAAAEKVAAAAQKAVAQAASRTAAAERAAAAAEKVVASLNKHRVDLTGE